MAVWLSISAREHVSKLFAIWFPTATFVALAFDHVVANMYFVPIAIFNGSPDITVSYYIWKSLIPALLGNIVGGFIFVALPYWYLFLTDTDGVDVDFNLGGAISTVNEQSGPDRKRLMKDSGHNIIHGREIDPEHPASHLPHSGSGLQSQISKELDRETYGKSYAEREKMSNDDVADEEV